MEILFCILALVNSLLLIHFYLKYKELLIVFVRLMEKAPILLDLLKESEPDEAHDDTHGFI